jgi:hypothetical protein
MAIGPCSQRVVVRSTSRHERLLYEESSSNWLLDTKIADQRIFDQPGFDSSKRVNQIVTKITASSSQTTTVRPCTKAPAASIGWGDGGWVNTRISWVSRVEFHLVQQQVAIQRQVELLPEQVGSRQKDLGDHYRTQEH